MSYSKRRKRSSLFHHYFFISDGFTWHTYLNMQLALALAFSLPRTQKNTNCDLQRVFLLHTPDVTATGLRENQVQILDVSVKEVVDLSGFKHTRQRLATSSWTGWLNTETKLQVLCPNFLINTIRAGRYHQYSISWYNWYHLPIPLQEGIVSDLTIRCDI